MLYKKAWTIPDFFDILTGKPEEEKQMPNFESIPLTDEEWSQIRAPFLHSGRPLEILDDLRKWKNAPVVLRWIGGRDESAVNTIKTRFKQDGLPFKMVNSQGPGPRATRTYYTQIQRVK